MPTVRSPGGLALEEVFHPNRNKHKDIRKERPFLHPSSPKTALPCDLQGWERDRLAGYLNSLHLPKISDNRDLLRSTGKKVPILPASKYYKYFKVEKNKKEFFL